jgi:hypothetical protein
VLILSAELTDPTLSDCAKSASSEDKITLPNIKKDIRCNRNCGIDLRDS